MSSLAQIAANRRNALLSTGPRTPEGKAAVRFNALKHGIDALSLCIPGEDPVALQSLADAYFQQFCPAGPVEAHLVDTIILSDWNQRRYSRIEAQMFNLCAGHRQPPARSIPELLMESGPASHQAALRHVFRRLQAARADWFRASKELRRLQEERRAAEAETGTELAEAPEPPIEIGFDPPKPRPAQPAPAGHTPKTPVEPSPNPAAEPDASIPARPRTGGA